MNPRLKAWLEILKMAPPKKRLEVIKGLLEMTPPEKRLEMIKELLASEGIMEFDKNSISELRSLEDKTRREITKEKIENDFIPSEYCSKLKKEFQKDPFEHSFKFGDLLCFKKEHIEEGHPPKPFVMLRTVDTPVPAHIGFSEVIDYCDLLIGRFHPSGERMISYIPSHMVEKYNSDLDFIKSE